MEASCKMKYEVARNGCVVNVYSIWQPGPMAAARTYVSRTRPNGTGPAEVLAQKYKCNPSWMVRLGREVWPIVPNPVPLCPGTSG